MLLSTLSDSGAADLNPQTKTLIKQCFKGVNEEDEEDKRALKQAAINAAAGLSSSFLYIPFFS